MQIFSEKHCNCTWGLINYPVSRFSLGATIPLCCLFLTSGCMAIITLKPLPPWATKKTSSLGQQSWFLVWQSLQHSFAICNCLCCPELLHSSGQFSLPYAQDHNGLINQSINLQESNQIDWRQSSISNFGRQSNLKRQVSLVCMTLNPLRTEWQILRPFLVECDDNICRLLCGRLTNWKRERNVFSSTASSSPHSWEKVIFSKMENFYPKLRTFF